MTSEEFERRCEPHSFRPFTLHVAGGRAIPVIHRDYAYYVGDDMAYVYQEDFRLNVVDLTLVTDIELPPPEAGEWPFQE